MGPAPRDFSHRIHFPGTDSSRFDIAILAADHVDRLPSPFFALLLALIAVPVIIFNQRAAILLWLFMLADWALLIALPIANRSYGPPKPPTVLLALLRWPPALLPFPLFVLLELIGTLLVIYAFWIEPQRVSLTRLRLSSPKIPLGTIHRILHLGDLHIERETARERQVVKLAESLAPDLILFSGDFLSLSCIYDPVAWAHAGSILRRLSARLGIYAVRGSPPVDVPEVVAQLLEGTGVRLLEGEAVTVADCVRLVGLDCTHRPHIDASRLSSIYSQDTPEFTILLYHTPDLAPAAATYGIDLQLSGHTHGGQVRIPILGALYTSSLYGKRFEAGRYQIGAMALYVTRGIGMEGKGAPRVRLLCPPEVTLWEITGSKIRCYNVNK